ncbi:MAG: molybdate transport system ATP-binding protein [Comamonadaceae bacterium]|nr:MAG: molybdate transport system ATP-binding protein [Comamonadaceae bacterium]
MSGIQARFQLDWPGFTLDVDLDLPARGVTALFGHSGSGKTTLLRCIAGLERAPLGRITVNGEVWQDNKHWLPTHQRPLGYVFQEASLFPHLTVLGNLRYGLKRTSEAQRVSLDAAIELLGIGHLLERKPDRLSGGERQRVSMARALALSPRLLLMDEPLAALDLKRKQEILPYLERLHRELDMPVLYVSHSPDEVARLADHIVVMEAGRAVAAGPLTETLARVDLPIHLGEDAGVVLDAVVAERDAPWHLARVEFPGGSLWVRDAGHALGDAVRVRILARDVSIALVPVHGISIQNCLPATLEQIATDHHPALALLRLKVGSSPMLARLTQRSAAGLGLMPGMAVWVQIKAVALIG